MCTCASCGAFLFPVVPIDGVEFDAGCALVSIDFVSEDTSPKLDTPEKIVKALYALKNMKNMTQMPKQYVNTVFELLFSTAKLAKLSKEEQKMIDEAQKAKWDNYAIHKAAIDSGLRQGLQQGLRQGLQQGLNVARQEMAKKMLLDNESVDKIVKYTELSEADVLAIKAALDQS